MDQRYGAERGALTCASTPDKPLRALMGIVGWLLLNRVLNVANLLIARATNRQRETAVRVRIGAGWGRIIRRRW